MGTDVVRRRGRTDVRPHRAAGVAVAAALLGTALACGGGDDGGDAGRTVASSEEGGGAGSAAGALAAAAAAEADTLEPAGQAGGGDQADGGGAGGEAQAGGGGAPGTTASGDTGGSAPDLPPPTFPPAAPPTTAAGTEPLSVPGADGDDPLFGQVFVDLEPGGYGDYAVQLRQGQSVQVLSSADDGILTHTEVFAPDGTVVGQWDSGEPGSITGYYWDEADVLPLTGTYIFRVRHVGGGHDRFVLTFYGEA